MTVAPIQPVPVAGTPPRNEHAHRVRIDKRATGRILGAAVGFGALYAVVTSAGGLVDSFEAATRAQPDWIVLGVVCEAASFVLLGELLKRLIGSIISRHTAIDLGLVVAGLGGVLPAAPAEGLLMARAELRRRNVDNRRAPLALAYSQWYTTRAALGLIALNAFALAAIVQTRVGGRFARLWVIGIPAAAVLMLLALSAWLANRRQTVEWITIAIGKLRPWRRTPVEVLRAAGAEWHADAQTLLGDRRNRATVMTVALLSIGADVACFSCAIRSVGIQLRPSGFLLIYGAYVVSSLVPFLPAGVGSVEAVVPAVLHHGGVPIVTGLAAVFVYRALGTILPAATGGFSLLRLRLDRDLAAVRHRNPGHRNERAPTDAGTALRHGMAATSARGRAPRRWTDTWGAA